MQQQELADQLTKECDAFVERFNKTYKFTKCTAETLRGIHWLAKDWFSGVVENYPAVKDWDLKCDLAINPDTCLIANHAHIEVDVLPMGSQAILRFNIPVPDRGKCMRGVDFYQVIDE